MSHIVKAAVIGQSFIYHYFNNKNEVFQEVINEIFAEILSKAEEVIKIDQTIKDNFLNFNNIRLIVIFKEIASNSKLASDLRDNPGILNNIKKNSFKSILHIIKQMIIWELKTRNYQKWMTNESILWRQIFCLNVDVKIFL